jgi:hypothetical protein
MRIWTEQTQTWSPRPRELRDVDTIVGEVHEHGEEYDRLAEAGDRKFEALRKRVLSGEPVGARRLNKEVRQYLEHREKTLEARQRVYAAFEHGHGVGRLQKALAHWEENSRGYLFRSMKDPEAIENLKTSMEQLAGGAARERDQIRDHLRLIAAAKKANAQSRPSLRAALIPFLKHHLEVARRDLMRDLLGRHPLLAAYVRIAARAASVLWSAVKLITPGVRREETQRLAQQYGQSHKQQQGHSYTQQKALSSPTPHNASRLTPPPRYLTKDAVLDASQPAHYLRPAAAPAPQQRRAQTSAVKRRDLAIQPPRQQRTLRIVRSMVSPGESPGLQRRPGSPARKHIPMFVVGTRQRTRSLSPP